MLTGAIVGLLCISIIVGGVFLGDRLGDTISKFCRNYWKRNE